MLRRKIQKTFLYLCAIVGVFQFGMIAKNSFLLSTQKYGELTDGSLRGIEIGMDRFAVEGKIVGPSKLKFVGYQYDGNINCPITYDEKRCSGPGRADTYDLRYSAWFYESISVHFDGDVVDRIRFTRRFIYLDS